MTENITIPRHVFNDMFSTLVAHEIQLEIHDDDGESYEVTMTDRNNGKITLVSYFDSLDDSESVKSKLVQILERIQVKTDRYARYIDIKVIRESDDMVLYRTAL